MKRAAALFLMCALAACGTGGQRSPGSPRLSYNGSTAFPAVVGEAIALTPAVSGQADQYAVTPALPSGLSLDARSGVISGTPTRPGAPATFVVSATSAGVRVTFALVLSVTEPPHGLSYAGPVTVRAREAMAPLTPKITGSVDRYTISPPLPSGLVLDGLSGMLSGTPLAPRSVEPYTITAESLAGSARFVLVLTVTPSQSEAMPRRSPTKAAQF